MEVFIGLVVATTVLGAFLFFNGKFRRFFRERIVKEPATDPKFEKFFGITVDDYYRWSKGFVPFVGGSLLRSNQLSYSAAVAADTPTATL
jgi:hypothetical protein